MVEILARFTDSNQEVIQSVSFSNDGIVEIVELQGESRKSIRLVPEAGYELFRQLKERYDSSDS